MTERYECRQIGPELAVDIKFARALLVSSKIFLNYSFEREDVKAGSVDDSYGLAKKSVNGNEPAWETIDLNIESRDRLGQGFTFTLANMHVYSLGAGIIKVQGAGGRRSAGRFENSKSHKYELNMDENITETFELKLREGSDLKGFKIYHHSAEFDEYSRDPVVYVFGGHVAIEPDKHGIPSNAVYKIFPERREDELQEVITKGSAPSPRVMHSSCITQVGMFVHGGKANLGMQMGLGDLYCLRLRGSGKDSMHWDKICTSEARVNAAMCCLRTESAICIFGGESDDGMTNTFLRHTLGSRELGVSSFTGSAIPQGSMAGAIPTQVGQRENIYVVTANPAKVFELSYPLN